MGRRHTCNCYDCVYTRADRQELQHGGLDWETDEEALVPYKKPARKPYGGRKKRPCKKSKTGEVCDFSDTRIKGSRVIRDGEGNWVGYEPRTIRCCSRCGKEDWSYYSSWYV